jgi:hypothetical protein
MAQAQCVQCCANNHAAGYKSFYADVITCACTSGGCLGNFEGGTASCTQLECTSGSLGATCFACAQSSISAGGLCESQVAAECQSNAQCVAYVDCANTCPP